MIKESRKQTRKEKQGERENRVYTKKERGEKTDGSKVEDRKRRRQKGRGHQQNKIKNICFI